MKSRFQTVTIQKTGVWATCQRCAHEWLYTGAKNFTNCTNCHTTVTLNAKRYKKLVQEGKADQTNPLTNPTETQTHSNLDHLARRPNNDYDV